MAAETDRIVMLGDSMTDTLDFGGAGFPDLTGEMKKYFVSPISFLNHGVGSTGVAQALERLTQPYPYTARNRQLPAVLETNPSLVVIESCAYNGRANTPTELEQFTDIHRKIIDTLHALKNPPKLLLYSTIAPSRDHFAEPVAELNNWSSLERVERYETVMAHLSRFSRFAQTSGLPFVDVAKHSLDRRGSGRITFVSNVDYIHPSAAGRKFIAQKLASMIYDVLSPF